MSDEKDKLDDIEACWQSWCRGDWEAVFATKAGQDFLESPELESLIFRNGR